MNCAHNNQYAIIVAGSSITDCQTWPTWSYYMQKVFEWPTIIDTSVKGLGNEHILFRAVDRAQQVDNPFLLVQLTSIDKWDWYVDQPEIVQKLSEQKHPLISVHKDAAGGFWSTGSHFPLYKEYFRQNYYSHDYFVWKTLLLLQWFRGICAKNDWPYYILFDSPIFAVTEEQLNQGKAEYTTVDAFLQSPLSSTIADLWTFEDIYLPGLIGYAKSKNLPWWSDKFKGHPGSLIHYLFSKDIILPALEKHFQSYGDIDDFSNEAKKWQSLIDQV